MDLNKFELEKLFWYFPNEWLLRENIKFCCASCENEIWKKVLRLDSPYDEELLNSVLHS